MPRALMKHSFSSYIIATGNYRCIFACYRFRDFASFFSIKVLLALLISYQYSPYFIKYMFVKYSGRNDLDQKFYFSTTLIFRKNARSHILGYRESTLRALDSARLLTQHYRDCFVRNVTEILLPARKSIMVQ